jgi:uncharacterized protein (TIGR00299 family) protein
LSEITEIIERSSLSIPARDLATKIFNRLGQAEAKVHGVPIEEIHFHEVGAVDAIVDIVGFAVGYTMLGVEAAVCSPVAVGGGTVKMEHGVFPVPGPAVLNLLQDKSAPIAESAISYECLTPTGAAILTTIAERWSTLPAMQKIYATGYGAGTKDPDDWPNVTRVVIGESTPSNGARFDHDLVVIIEANIDDFNPQALAYAAERFLSLGALDVTVVPAAMKKGRSGHLISLIAKPEDRNRLEEAVLTETTTIGVRSYEARRTVALREWLDVSMENGIIRVKVAKDRAGKTINAQPEFEDCARYAMENNIPVKDVMSQVIAKMGQK